jgi:hypothetical protein
MGSFRQYGFSRTGGFFAELSLFSRVFLHSPCLRNGASTWSTLPTSGPGLLAQTASALKRTPAALGVDRGGKRSGLTGECRAWLKHAAGASEPWAGAHGHELAHPRGSRIGTASASPPRRRLVSPGSRPVPAGPRPRVRSRPKYTLSDRRGTDRPQSGEAIRPPPQNGVGHPRVFIPPSVQGIAEAGNT